MALNSVLLATLKYCARSTDITLFTANSAI